MQSSDNDIGIWEFHYSRDKAFAIYKTNPDPHLPIAEHASAVAAARQRRVLLRSCGGEGTDEEEAIATTEPEGEAVADHVF